MKPNHPALGIFAFLVLFSSLVLQGCSTTTQNERNASRQLIDLIIEGDYVVSMDVDGAVYKDAAIAVDKGLIIAIGSASEISSAYQSAHTLQGENRVVMPGLINGHSHAAMTLLRGVAEDMALVEWLNNYIFPAEVEFVDADFVRIGTELACWEMIRGGTTTFVDMYYFPDVIASVVESCGMRALVSATVIDQHSPDAENAADSLANGLAFINRWKGRNSRITPILCYRPGYGSDWERTALPVTMTWTCGKKYGWLHFCKKCIK
jgi:5-methylthioadenosine/S-adenosylhomocysteine deaminase